MKNLVTGIFAFIITTAMGLAQAEVTRKITATPGQVGEPIAGETYLLYGAQKPDSDDCESVSDEVIDELTREIRQTEPFFYVYNSTCLIYEGAEPSFFIQFILEPRSAEEIDALESYVAHHEGQKLHGMTIHFDKVGAVFTQIFLRYGWATESGDDWEFKELAEHLSNRVFQNYQSVFAEATMLDRVFEHAGWVEFYAHIFARFARDEIAATREWTARRSNYIFGDYEIFLITEDQQKVAEIFGEPRLQRDCRAFPTGRCE